MTSFFYHMRVEVSALYPISMFWIFFLFSFTTAQYLYLTKSKPTATATPLMNLFSLSLSINTYIIYYIYSLFIVIDSTLYALCSMLYVPHVPSFGSIFWFSFSFQLELLFFFFFFRVQSLGYIIYYYSIGIS
jgi:hypothetical protein